MPNSVQRILLEALIMLCQGTARYNGSSMIEEAVEYLGIKTKETPDDGLSL